HVLGVRPSAYAYARLASSRRCGPLVRRGFLGPSELGGGRDRGADRRRDRGEGGAAVRAARAREALPVPDPGEGAGGRAASGGGVADLPRADREDRDRGARAPGRAEGESDRDVGGDRQRDREYRRVARDRGGRSLQGREGAERDDGGR